MSKARPRTRPTSPAPETILLELVPTAKLLGMSPASLRTRVYRGQVPHVRVGGSIRFCPQALRAWIERQTVPASA